MPGTPKQPLINQTNTAVVEKMTDIVHLISTNKKLLRKRSYRKSAYATPFAASLSGVLYWLSANSAEERYGIMAVTLLPFCATVINALFNEECYLSMTELDDPDFIALTKELSSPSWKWTTLTYDIITGFCTMAPACYISLPGKEIQQRSQNEYNTKYVLALLSGAFNWPIYSCSSHALVEWCQKHSVLSRCFDNTIGQLSASSHTQYRMTLREDKNRLLEALSQFDYYYNSHSNNDRNLLLIEQANLFSDIENPTNHANLVLTEWFKWMKNSSKKYRRKKSHGYRANLLLNAVHVFLFICAIIQMAGYVVEAFNSGDLLESQFTNKPSHAPGFSIASTSLLTQLGFSVMLLEELADTANMVRYAEGPIEQKLRSRFFKRWFGVIGLIAFCSGTGSDVAGYNSFLQLVEPNCPVNRTNTSFAINVSISTYQHTPPCTGDWAHAGAQVWAILANIGAAIPYNFLMCVLLIKRLVGWKIEKGENNINEKNQLRFSRNIQTLKGIITAIPLSKLPAVLESIKSDTEQPIASYSK